MAKLLQINTARSRASLDLAIDYALKKSIDIICITEPPKLWEGKLLGTPGFEQSCNANAVILFNRRLNKTHAVNTNTQYTSCICIEDIAIVCVYCPPNMDSDAPFDEVREIASCHSKMLLTGDFNCRTSDTSSLPLRNRDHEFEYLIYDLGVKMENSTVPTLIHQGRETINDYTLTRGCTIAEWQVLVDEESLSDHRYISFKMSTEATLDKWLRYKIDEEKLAAQIEDCPFLVWNAESIEEVHFKAETVTNWLTHCMDLCTSTTEIRSQVYWWTDNLQKIKEEIKKVRRKRFRTADENSRILLAEKLKELRLSLRNGIAKEKIKKWREFTSLSHPWGQPYKLVVKPKEGSGVHPHLQMDNGRVTTTEEEAIRYLMQVKFPTAAPPLEVDESSLTENEFEPEITREEVATALKSSKNRSAPGPDRINYKTLKIVNMKHPSLFQKLFNECLKFSVFPSVWKEGKVVWLRKLGKDERTAGAYRPLTLLSTLGKTMEKIIAVRVKNTVQLSPAQYGFVKGRSTEDCLHSVLEEVRCRRNAHHYTAMVALDIAGAFDHVSWPHTVAELRRKGVSMNITRMIQSYFQERIITGNKGIQRRALCCGCPQGSVLGPLLWNVGYDCVLSKAESHGLKCFAYADDTLLVISAASRKELATRVEEAIKIIRETMRTLNLELNIGKTEILVFGNVINTSPITITVDIAGTMVTSGEWMKYLGVIIDWRLCWTPHIKYLVKKSEKTLPKILSLCQNTFGYSTEARKTMLHGTVGGYFRYAASCYAHVLVRAENRKIVSKIHQKMATCIGRLYRTTSYLGACAITGQVPMALDVIGRSILSNARKNRPIKWSGLKKADKEVPRLEDHVGREIQRVWQKWWDDYKESLWTKTLIPTVRYQTPEVDFYVAQALSGHGCFRAYRKRIRRHPTGLCPLCSNCLETAEHVLTVCPRFAAGRLVPLDWREMNTRAYMRKTVQTLWKEEQEEERRKKGPYPPSRDG